MVSPMLMLLLACSSPCPTSAVVSTPSTLAGWVDFDPDRAACLDDALVEAVADLGPPGAAMAVADHDARTLWVGATGLANLDAGHSWQPDDPFPIGSVTKTFTASLVFLLMEEGLLNPDDPLEHWVPGSFAGQGVTLRHLLSNTSGIASYNYVGSFDESTTWTPEELVQWAVDHQATTSFEPGSSWEYSNTNWVLLGLVIEAATGASYLHELHERLLDPLGLEHTVLWGEEDYEGTLVRGYEGEADVTDGTDPSFGWAAGAIVSTPHDLARWGGALYGGKVLNADSFALMTERTVLSTGETVDYGMGAFSEYDAELGRFYGHTGGISSHATYLYCLEDQTSSVVVMSNTFEVDVKDMAVYPWEIVLDTRLR
jgi:D-alanyl-D-alanine carboxypeptidase